MTFAYIVLVTLKKRQSLQATLRLDNVKIDIVHFIEINGLIYLIKMTVGTMQSMKHFKRNKDLIKSAIDKAIKAADRPETEKLADYVLRLNKIKLSEPDIKKVLENLHNFQ